MEYGTELGLAQNFQANERINDLRYRNHMMKQSQAESEAKAKMFADDLDFQNAANSYDNPIIKQHAKDTILKIGQYVRQNPDYANNPNKLAEIKLMKNELRDNPHLLRGMASDASFKQLNADLAEVAKNPEAHDTEAYQELLNQKNNYLKYGNQFGAEAAQKQGAQPFVYTKPKEFVNLPKALMELGSNITNYDIIKGKNPGEAWTAPNPNDVQNAKISAMQEHKRQILIEAKNAGITDPNKIDQWVHSQIAAGFKKNYWVGDVNALFERDIKKRELNAKLNKGNGAGYSPWDDLFDPRKPAGNVPVDLVRKVWNDNPKMEISGTNGKKVDLTGHKFNYDGRYVTSSNGQRFLTGYVDLPLDLAEEKGIYDAPYFGSNDINGAFLNVAKIEKKEDKDGKIKEYVRVNHALPIDYHDGTGRQMYNAQAQPDKLVEGLKYENNPSGEKTYNGIPVGSVGMYKGKKVRITESGPVEIE
jgi:hypothetical protein